MNNRSRGGSAAYTANVAKPTRQRAVSARGLVGILLSLLLPPLGLMYLWRLGVFRTRGRMLITVLATVEMMFICVALTRPQGLTAQKPVPAAPAGVTAAPEGQALTALYNIEQLLYEQQLAQVLEQGGTASDLLTEEEKLNVADAQREQTLNTIVYSVFSGAKRYHAGRVCGTQTNGRELTVREAMSEALIPCPDCSPPVVQ